jgi:hypothetical protein
MTRSEGTIFSVFFCVWLFKAFCVFNIAHRLSQMCCYQEYLYTKLLYQCISKKTPRNFVLYVEKLQFIREVVLVVLLKLIPSSTLIQTNTILTNYF